MQTNLAEDFAPARAEDTIERLRNGEKHLRNYLIESYQSYILSIVSKMIGKNAKFSDEFSVALQAFNEAIDCFDFKQGVSFINFSSMVINRRVIDHIRKSSKFNAEYPFSYFEVNDNEDYVESITAEQPTTFTQKIEVQEELFNFKADLKSYGITFEDLVKLAPKHADTKIMCVSIAKMLVENKELSEKLQQEKRLPIAEIISHFTLNRKTLDNHRKYIIALYLILKSDMDIIKGYISFLTKGV